LALHLSPHALVLLREAAALCEQRGDADVAIEVQRIDPRELLPYLEVAQIVDGEARRRDAPVLGRRLRAAAADEQLGVARVDVDHVLALRVEEVLEDEVD